ncbi:MAG TPA: single-stranded DNA-binding protein [Vicinamibacterales bacterium]|nr:single-stranded DNA-binding protein [Vicinamibacterales bacterium]
MSLNRAILIGRITKDPDLKYTPSGVAVANFTVAVDRNQAPNAQGEKETDFVPCVAFKQSAEFAGNYLGKGRLVAVEGRIQVRAWTAQDGSKRWTTEILVDRLQGLDKPREQGAGPVDADGEDPFGDE